MGSVTSSQPPQSPSSWHVTSNNKGYHLNQFLGAHQDANQVVVVTDEKERRSCFIWDGAPEIHRENTLLECFTMIQFAKDNPDTETIEISIRNCKLTEEEVYQLTKTLNICPTILALRLDEGVVRNTESLLLGLEESCKRRLIELEIEWPTYDSVAPLFEDKIDQAEGTMRQIEYSQDLECLTVTNISHAGMCALGLGGRTMKKLHTLSISERETVDDERIEPLVDEAGIVLAPVDMLLYDLVHKPHIKRLSLELKTAINSIVLLAKGGALTHLELIETNPDVHHVAHFMDAFVLRMERTAGLYVLNGVEVSNLPELEELILQPQLGTDRLRTWPYLGIAILITRLPKLKSFVWRNFQVREDQGEKERRRLVRACAKHPCLESIDLMSSDDGAYEKLMNEIKAERRRPGLIF